MNAGVEEEGSVEKGRGLGNGSVTGLRKEMTPFSLICGEHAKREVYMKFIQSRSQVHVQVVIRQCILV